MKTIHHVVDIATDADTVYRMLTTQPGLAGWWSIRVDAPDTTVGTVVDFTFVDDFNPDMRIVEADRGNLLVWRCVGGHENWKDGTFRFELAEDDGGGTRLRFWQEYAVELGDDDYGIYNFNWGYYLHSLQLLCETGTGTPYEPS